MSAVPTSTTAATVAASPTLRASRPDDLAAIERLLADAALPLDGVAAALDHFTVAEHDGALVGVAGLEPCGAHALLRSVAVRDAWRAHGVGRALVERTLADADARGIPALYLLTTTADAYFPRFGFAVVPRDAVPADVRATAEFRETCPASATVMRRARGARADTA